MTIVKTALIASLLATPAWGAPAVAVPKHPAAVKSRAACPDPQGMLSRAAYIPAADAGSGCARPLATDTIMVPHTWNRT